MKKRRTPRRLVPDALPPSGRSSSAPEHVAETLVETAAQTAETLVEKAALAAETLVEKAAQTAEALAEKPAQDAVMLAEKLSALFDERNVLDTLQRIVDLSVETVDGCDGASVSFVEGDTIVTPVWTNDVVVEVDLLQYESGEGPCLDAVKHETAFYSADLANDPHWPAFGPLAAARGMNSLLSFPLRSERMFGSLNLYGCSHAAYGVASRMHALALSIHAGMALTAADTLERTTRAASDESKRLEQMERALSSSQTIAFAQGMLMADEAVDEQEAFTLLRRASLRVNRKLSDVADHVVKTGGVPSGPVETQP